MISIYAPAHGCPPTRKPAGRTNPQTARSITTDLLRRALVIAGLMVLGACAQPAALGGPTPVEVVRRAAAEYAFYDVSGATTAALWASMREGSARTLGGPYFARTEWTVTWRARWGGTGVCRVSSADVRLAARVTLPSWAPPADAPQELVGQWNAFVRALSLHEARHVDIAAAAVRGVRREVEAISAPTCSGIEALARAAAERVLTAHREQDRQYDQRTRNGATEGATWPPRPLVRPDRSGARG